MVPITVHELFPILTQNIRIGRHPVKHPAHALLECLKLGQRRPRNRCEGHITLSQVHEGSISMIHVEGSTGQPSSQFGPNLKDFSRDYQVSFTKEELAGDSSASRRRGDFVIFDLRY